MEIQISDHYEAKHRESINDDLILKLIKKHLHGSVFLPVDSDGQYEYFVNDKIGLEGKLYKLIWMIEKDCLYIGVINAYRR